MKYIRYKNNGFLIFPLAISHKSAAKLIRDEIISAGFVGMPLDWSDDEENNMLCCYGKSETLKKESLPEDSQKLHFWMENM